MVYLGREDARAREDALPFDPRTICLTMDVEWACAEILADLCRLLDERQLRATFFVTHSGVEVAGHERGLHPNFRRNGDTLRAFRAAHPLADESKIDELSLYRFVLQRTHAFASEARGVRSHSLYYDSQLLEIYREIGIEYDATYLIPLKSGLLPFWKEYGILECPTYFSDHFELKSGLTGFDTDKLALSEPGLKIINFHPNMLYINAVSNEHYMASRKDYHNHEKLLKERHSGIGVRSMFIDLLDRIVAEALPTATLGEINRLWRGWQPWAGR
ncbi:hypothetical protein [Candidatus Magnetaquicoccus inordinatus]|uniref:polysaccharide deacetylase WbmS family protein n=1 Tax=Candidatus Magnetaquicoccus inordinatus TaxID=2496818 RepID=UPI00102B6BE2|nr:hypothetical protein [Candidatus Magnetaquicoccus inordinatus]